MNCKIEHSQSRHRCTLTVDPALKVVEHVWCPYDDDVIAYAAMRVIRHSPNVCDCLVEEAVRLGLTFGKRKPRQLVVRANSVQAQLPGTSIRIAVTITAGTATIKQVTIM